MPTVDQYQELIGRHAGAEAVAIEALRLITESVPGKAHELLIEMRTALSDKFRNSDIVPEREMEHAAIVRPVLEEIERLLGGAINDLS